MRAYIAFSFSTRLAILVSARLTSAWMAGSSAGVAALPSASALSTSPSCSWAVARRNSALPLVGSILSASLHVSAAFGPLLELEPAHRQVQQQRELQLVDLLGRLAARILAAGEQLHAVEKVARRALEVEVLERHGAALLLQLGRRQTLLVGARRVGVGRVRDAARVLLGLRRGRTRPACASRRTAPRTPQTRRAARRTDRAAARPRCRRRRPPARRASPARRPSASPAPAPPCRRRRRSARARAERPPRRRCAR